MMKKIDHILDCYEMANLAGLIRQMGLTYFSNEPDRLSEQVSKLMLIDGIGFGNKEQREAVYRVLETLGWSPESFPVMRERAENDTRRVCRRMCHTISRLTEAEVRSLLTLAAKKAEEQKQQLAD